MEPHIFKLSVGWGVLITRKIEQNLINYFKNRTYRSAHCQYTLIEQSLHCLHCTVHVYLPCCIKYCNSGWQKEDKIWASMYHVHCAYAEYCNRIMGTFCFLPFPVLSTSAFLLQSFAGKLAPQPSSLVPHCTPYANCCTWPQPEQII